MIDFQIEMEKLFHKNQLIPRIQEEFKEHKEFFEPMFDQAQISDDFGYDLLTQLVLHKRAKLPVLVGIFRKQFMVTNETDGCQEAADAILRAIQANLADYQPLTRDVIIRFDISEDVQLELDRYQFPLPMVVEPLPLKNNRDTGYYTQKTSVIMKDNYHESDVCLDHINRMNGIKFKLNMNTALTIKNRWRNLDKPKPGEEIQEYRKRQKQFEKYDRVTHDVLTHLGIATGGEFHLTHKYDKRGRVYCTGYHVNYQGAPWNKAVIEFANEEVTQ